MNFTEYSAEWRKIEQKEALSLWLHLKKAQNQAKLTWGDKGQTSGYLK